MARRGRDDCPLPSPALPDNTLSGQWASRDTVRVIDVVRLPDGATRRGSSHRYLGRASCGRTEKRGDDLEGTADSMGVPPDRGNHCFPRTQAAHVAPHPSLPAQRRPCAGHWLASGRSQRCHFFVAATGKTRKNDGALAQFPVSPTAAADVSVRAAPAPG